MADISWAEAEALAVEAMHEQEARRLALAEREAAIYWPKDGDNGA